MVINLQVDVVILRVCDYHLGNKLWLLLTYTKLLLFTVVHNGFLYIFGGFNRNMDLHFQDINRYDPESSTWMTISPKGKSPCARRRQICLVINNRVFISGGTSPVTPKDPVPMRQMDYDLTDQIFNQLRDHDDLHVLDLSKLFLTLF